ncbi:hypothetical protein B0H21DRAFT_583731 [Amylocystis lapponica]|nr:hypothetical protein B0H21DRAFT_583731 [Amylocystis lapponica]
MIDIEWDKPDASGRRHRPQASTIHGWITKWRGTLFGSESTRRKGIREMKEARAIRKYRRKRDAERRQRARQERGGIFSFVPASSRSSSRRKKSRREAVVPRDYAHGRTHSHHRKRHDQPLLHFPHRSKPHHHGHGTQLKGYLTGDHELVLRGKEMSDRASGEREKETRRRHRRSKKEADAIRNGGAANKWKWNE